MVNETSSRIAIEAKYIRDNPDFVVKPRDMEVREIIGGQYKVPMPAFIDNADRKVNYAFMFAEAAWIVSGSNRLSDLTETMKSYANYSDDGIFLRGAYGPKVVDQLGHVVDVLEKDNDSRQAYINIWRERPKESLDIPCTVGMQFLIRGNSLIMSVTMRSHDIVLGSTYDVFSFSAIANSVRLLLKARNIDVHLGDLTITAGSLHLYERHYDKINDWVDSNEVNEEIANIVADAFYSPETYEQFIDKLKETSKNLK